MNMNPDILYIRGLKTAAFRPQIGNGRSVFRSKKPRTLCRGASFLKRQGGVISVLVVISIIALLSMGALAVDLAHLYLARAELQDIADAAALAGASGLAEGSSVAVSRAKDYAQYNKVVGENFELEDGDIEIGIWDFDNRTFTPGGAAPNAVRVTARRTQDSPQGEVPLLFAKLLGNNKAAVVAQATAAVVSRDVMLVLDKSWSMGELEGIPDGPWDPNGPKMQAVKDGANLFIDLLINQSLTEDQVGVVWYNHNAYLESELTDDIGQLHSVINGTYAGGGTSISEGLSFGITELISNRADPHNKKVIVMLTDGRATTCVPLPEIPGWLESPDGHGSPGCDVDYQYVPWDNSDFWGNPRAKREVIYLAEQAADEGIVIYSVTLGTPAQIDETLMQEAAKRTGGLYFTTDDPDNIIDIFQTIAERVDVSLVR